MNHWETKTPDSYTSKTVLDSGKPLAVALGGLVLIGGLVVLLRVGSENVGNYRIGHLESKIESLERQVDDLKNQNQQLNNTVYELRQNVNSTNRRVDQMNPQITITNKTGIVTW